MKKLRLLLLDANVIIELFKIGIWDRLVERCDIYLAQSVVGESEFFDTEAGERKYINLEPDITAGKISIFELPASRLIDFQKQFDCIYTDRLDPGERESLAFLCSSDQQYVICSADAIVYRILGNLNRPDQGLSLEEVLGSIGLGRALSRQFTKSFRIGNTTQGQRDSIQGKGKLG